MRKVESGMIRAAKELLAKWTSKEERKVEEGDMGGWSVDQVTMFLDDLLVDWQTRLKSEGRRKMAEECYEKNKLFYHICAKMVAQDLAQNK